MVKPPTSEGICLRCKGGRMLCGKPRCPILLKSSILKSILPQNFKKIQRDKTVFGSSPPAVFVGHQGYPKVNFGPMIPIDHDVLERLNIKGNKKDTSILDRSELWFGKKIEEIVGYRSAMVRSNFRVNVFSGGNFTKPMRVDEISERMDLSNRKLLDASQELAMSASSVDTESKFSKIRSPALTYDINSAPSGPSGSAIKIDIIDNIKPHPKVEYVVSDTDLKSTDAIVDYLYPTNLSGSEVKDPRDKSMVTESEIQRIFSAGLLGQSRARRLVPTRWSITAVDDIISKHLAEQIKRFPQINEYITFHTTYIDNNFIILLIPGPWSFEMMEIWQADSIWTQAVPGVQQGIKNQVPNIIQDHEMEKGRKNYANHITGAYYAARKEVTEFLFRNRRQARCVVFREVSGGYITPLGVWVIRESVKNALAPGFAGAGVQKTDTLRSAVSRINNEFTVPLEYWMRTSKLLKEIRKQRRIDEWMKK